MKFTDDLEMVAWSQRPFASEVFRAQAYADARYKSDPHWRAAVASKEAISSMGIEPKVYNDSQSVEVVSGGIGTKGSEAHAQLRNELTSVEEQMIEKYGRQSVAPAPKAPRTEPSAKEASQFNKGGITVNTYPAF